MPKRLPLSVLFQENPIIEYLESEGVSPSAKQSERRIKYLCPLPGHKESKPSFCVDPTADPQLFYCFGCQRGGTIIDLVVHMEGLTVRDAIRKLGKDLDIDPEELERKYSKQIKAAAAFRPPDTDLDQQLMSMSRICRHYLRSVGDTAEERRIIDSFWSKVDERIMEFEFDAVAEMAENLQSILAARQDKLTSNS